MTLRLRILSIVALTLIPLFAVLYGASAAILMGGYARLEVQEMEREIARAQQAILANLNALATGAKDWGSFDDSYRFMADGNRDFVNANLVASAFVTLDADFVLLLRSDGSLFEGRQYAGEELISPSLTDLSEILAGGKFNALSDDAGAVTSIVSVQGKPMLVAAAPILTSEVTGPNRGTMLMARFLTDERLKRVAESGRMSLSLVSEQEAAVDHTKPFTIRTEGDETIAGYLRLDDMKGRTVTVLRVESPRWIYQHGLASQRYLLINLALAGVVFLAVVLVSLERIFLARLARLDGAISVIQQERDAAVRVPVEGKDELGRLAVTINDTLESLQATQEQLHHDALHDPLTGLANRTLFMRRIDTALDNARQTAAAPFAVVLIDLDHFKMINDRFGHAAGDQLLRTVARRMTSVLRPSDLAARLGGDEFAVLLEPIQDTADATRCAERLLNALWAPLELQQRQMQVSGSIGVALFTSAYRTADELLLDADAAMYRAKQRGRNQIALFDEGMGLQALGRVTLERELRHAVENGELRVHYHPVIDLRTRRVRALEALVRWQHPEHGLLAPDRFIYVAENAGFQCDIDRWVLAEACRCQARWLAQFDFDDPPIVSVNFSSRHIHLPDLATQVERVLVQTGVPGSQMGLEITESALAVAERDLFTQLQSVSRLGVQICLDDFGTGYSSLSRLPRLPVKMLKVDRVFVAEMDGSNRKTTPSTLVAVAHSLGMEVIAEGVESEAQVQGLLECGCEFAQGFFFAAPLTEEGATAMLQEMAARGTLTLAASA